MMLQRDLKFERCIVQSALLEPLDEGDRMVAKYRVIAPIRKSSMQSLDSSIQVHDRYPTITIVLGFSQARQ